jgi:hypothetical protein
VSIVWNSAHLREQPPQFIGKGNQLVGQGGTVLGVIHHLFSYLTGSITVYSGKTFAGLP